jgi:hypothetical protein
LTDGDFHIILYFRPPEAGFRPVLEWGLV